MKSTDRIAASCRTLLIAVAMVSCGGGTPFNDGSTEAGSGNDAAAPQGGSGGSGGAATGGSGGVATGGSGGAATGGASGGTGGAGGAGGAPGPACMAGAMCTSGFTCEQPCRTGGLAGTISCFCAPNNLLACQTCVPTPVPTCPATVVAGQPCMLGTDLPCNTACVNGVNARCTCINVGGGNAAWRCLQNAMVCQ